MTSWAARAGDGHAGLLDLATRGLGRDGGVRGGREITASKVKNMKELRPGSTGRSEIRILFVFDPWQQIVLLVAGDKAGDWRGWYRKTIPRAEQLYAEHLEAMSNREEGG
jgi:hypothetical protein